MSKNKNYRIVVEETVLTEFLIEAESVEAAEDIVKMGNYTDSNIENVITEDTEIVESEESYIPVSN